MLKDLTRNEALFIVGCNMPHFCNCGNLNKGTIAEDIINSIMQPTSNATTCMNYLSSAGDICPTDWCNGAFLATSKSCFESCCTDLNPNNATISLDWFEYVNST